ncbi:hypothetical protein [Corallococcus terminator]|uniref:Uncharacterized protein n=1 Tax=Corallococcus terminator TaxID=2316733 RepID=A0A3A8I303_9BACT|nr:hypothetical protein [Corallococcus terminator]RKG74114.1 hypothetical protein D7V88_35345 [Corallococcus terminator]
MASSRHRPKSRWRKLLGGFVVAVAESFAPDSVLADGAPKRDVHPRHGRIPGKGYGSRTLGIQGADPRPQE